MGPALFACAVSGVIPTVLSTCDRRDPTEPRVKRCRAPSSPECAALDSVSGLAAPVADGTGGSPDGLAVSLFTTVIDGLGA